MLAEGLYTDKNHEKKMGIFPKFSQNENNFLNYLSILITIWKKSPSFSPNFPMIFVSVGLKICVQCIWKLLKCEELKHASLAGLYHMIKLMGGGLQYLCNKNKRNSDNKYVTIINCVVWL